ncbi:MAG: PDZ domain-containing protein, partial [Sandaracinaceae bacterium]|nr:PDZ domain-containing protein [Sandaracinaceae bacterium]
IARIVPQLIEHGRFVRPGLGVSLGDPRQYRVPLSGAMVLGVAPNSPAAQAGIQPVRRDTTTGDVLLGDVIVSIDGEPVREPLDLYRILDRREIGQQVRVGLQRGRERVEVQAQLAAIESG